VDNIIERLNELEESQTIPPCCVVCSAESVQSGKYWAVCSREKCFNQLKKVLKEVEKK